MRFAGALLSKRQTDLPILFGDLKHLSPCPLLFQRFEEENLETKSQGHPSGNFSDYLLLSSAADIDNKISIINLIFDCSFMNKMNTNIPKKTLSEYINKQLELHFPDGANHEESIYEQLGEVLERIEYCFSKINNKYYLQNKTVQFDYLNTDQYATLLYLLSHLLWKNGSDISVAKKVYYLNKIMHGLEVYYEVELPEIFRFTHPVGTVLGRAKYSDYLIVSQGVTIGGNKDLVYPNIGSGVFLYAGSAVIGDSNIGDNSLISIGAVVRDANIPSDSLVYNEGNVISYKPFSWTVVGKFFKK